MNDWSNKQHISAILQILFCKKYQYESNNKFSDTDIIVVVLLVCCCFFLNNFDLIHPIVIEVT